MISCADLSIRCVEIIVRTGWMKLSRESPKALSRNWDFAPTKVCCISNHDESSEGEVDPVPLIRSGPFESAEIQDHERVYGQIISNRYQFSQILVSYENNFTDRIAIQKNDHAFSRFLPTSNQRGSHETSQRDRNEYYLTGRTTHSWVRKRSAPPGVYL